MAKKITKQQQIDNLKTALFWSRVVFVIVMISVFITLFNFGRIVKVNDRLFEISDELVKDANICLDKYVALKNDCEQRELDNIQSLEDARKTGFELCSMLSDSNVTYEQANHFLTVEGEMGYSFEVINNISYLTKNCSLSGSNIFLTMTYYDRVFKFSNFDMGVCDDIEKPLFDTVELNRSTFSINDSSCYPVQFLFWHNGTIMNDQWKYPENCSEAN